MYKNKKILVAIPARYSSQRLPAKPLVSLNGTPMIVRVYQQASLSALADDIIVLTDDQTIADALDYNKCTYAMTPKDIHSGTERVLTFAHNYDADVIVNLQGDEPDFTGELLDNLIRHHVDSGCTISTMSRPITDSGELFDYHIVKVITDIHSNALYFSRQAIPGQRDRAYSAWMNHHDYKAHIGVYAISRQVINGIINLPPCVIEEVESLEQLRWLYHGMAIKCLNTTYHPFGIDTFDDVKKWHLKHGYPYED